MVCSSCAVTVCWCAADGVQTGPFVVTSNEEVYQAMRDYQSNMNGFERARGWQSEIGKTMLAP